MSSTFEKVAFILGTALLFNLDSAVNGFELTDRWLFNDIENGHVLNLVRATNMTFVNPDNSTNTRQKVLSIEGNHFMSMGPYQQTDCIANAAKCGSGVGVSFWLSHKSFVSDILDDNREYLTTLNQFLFREVPSDFRWINCYRASDHGWSAATFHERCDHRGPTISLVRVRDEFIFGGFTYKGWEGTANKSCPGSFLFTLKNAFSWPAKKLVQQSNAFICANPESGPCFGDGDLFISDMADGNLTSYSKLHSYQLYGAAEKSDPRVLAGTGHFMPTEVEVFYMECHEPIGMELGIIADDKITASSYKNGDDTYAKHQGRLNNKGSVGAWVPAVMDANQWLKVAFDSKHLITGVATHGRKDVAEYVSEFLLEYEMNPSSVYILNRDGSKIFRNVNEKSQNHFFKSSYEASYLKFKVKAFQVSIALAVEIYGCATESCGSPLGLSTGGIKDSQITASGGQHPFYARLNGARMWDLGRLPQEGDYIQIDLLYRLYIRYIKTQGSSANDHYISSYKLSFRIEGSQWFCYVDFSGREMVFNVDSPASRKKVLAPYIFAQYIRLLPVTASGSTALRMELYGCRYMRGSNAVRQLVYTDNTGDKRPGFGIRKEDNKIRGLLKLSNKAIATQKANDFVMPQDKWSLISLKAKVNGNGNLHIEADGTKNSLTTIRSQNSPGHPSNLLIVTSMLTDKLEWLLDNIQISDLAVWRDVSPTSVSMSQLSPTLDLCNFDKNTCTWRNTLSADDFNWIHNTGCVPSRDLGTGPCNGYQEQGSVVSSGFMYIESSLPRKKGERARLESHFVVSAYKCVTFQYHMYGDHIGRLNVLAADRYGKENLLWRIAGLSNNTWQLGKAPIASDSSFKVIFEGLVGDGFLGDIAIDDVWFLAASCEVEPKRASRSVKGFTKSALIGHVDEFHPFLSAQLSSVGFAQTTFWTPCYQATKDGWEQDTFHSRCDEMGPTLIIVRKNNSVFGGFSDQDWKVSATQDLPSARAFLFSLNNNNGDAPIKIALKQDQRGQAIRNLVGAGPSFGTRDLVFRSMRSIQSSLGTTYELPENGAADFLVGEPEFQADDVEVLYAGDHMCSELCADASVECDSITGNCVCDPMDRNVEWCRAGAIESTSYFYQSAWSYWPLDNLRSLQNWKRLEMGTANGGVSSDPRGLSRQAISLDGVTGWVDLGEFNSTCATDLGLCTEGLTVSLWLRYGDSSRNKETIFLSSGSSVNDDVRFAIFKTNNNTLGEHVAIELTTRLYSFTYTFDVPKYIWTYVVLSWDKPSKVVVVYRNGELVDVLQYTMCFSSDYNVSNFHITLGVPGLSYPNASYDDIAIWYKPLSAEFIGQIYGFYKGKRSVEVNVTLEISNTTIEAWTDKESLYYKYLQGNITETLINLYRDASRSTNVLVHTCGGAVVTCNVTIRFGMDGYMVVQTLLNHLKSERKFGQFNCKLIKFENNHVPNKQLEIYDYNTSTSSIYIGWKHLKDQEYLGIFQGYEVQCNSSLPGDIYKVLEFMYFSSVEFTGLQPYMEYQCLLRALNLEGYGIESRISVTTAEMAPHLPPDNVAISNTSSTSLQIKWSPPANRTAGLIRGYRIFYFLSIRLTEFLTSGGVLNAIWIRNVTIRNTTHLVHEIHGLAKYTNYCAVALVFTIQDGPVSKPVCSLTDEDVPSVPPPNVIAENVSSSACKIRWGAVPQDSHNGILLGYQVFYKPSYSSHVENVTVSKTTFSKEVQGLAGYSRYTLWVAAFTSRGAGNWSRPAECFTDQRKPDSPPANVSTFALSASTCVVTWQAVPLLKQNGPIVGYYLKYKDVKAPTGQSPVTVNILGASERKYNISGLAPASKYYIGVEAYNLKGIGPSNNFAATICLTLEAAPTTPPQGLKVTGATKTSCYIEWKPVPEEHRNGVILGYRVFHSITELPDGVVPLPAGNMTFIYCTTEKGFDIVELETGVKYKIQVSAMTSAGSGNRTEPVICKTMEDAPSASPKNLTAKSTSPTSCQLNWKSISYWDQNGPILGYITFYRLAGTADYKFEKTNNTQHVIQNLKTNRLYEVAVSGFNSVANSNTTNVTHCFTHGPPPGPPDNVTAQNTSSTSCKVTWSPPPEAVQNGIILGYKLFCVKQGGHSGWLNMSFNASDRSVELLSLGKYTVYDIGVLAINIKGDGNISRTSCRTSEDAPSSAPVITVGKVTSRSIGFSWSEVPEDDRNGIVRTYTIKFWLTDDPRFGGVYKRASRSIKFVHLRTYSNHSIVVLATTIKAGNYSEPVTVLTSEAAPECPPAITTSRNMSAYSIFVEWVSPQCRIPGILRGHVVYYRHVNGSQLGPELNITLRDPNSTSCKITDLLVNTTYSISVTSFTVVESDRSVAVLTSTDDKVLPPPDGIPLNVSDVSVTSTSCRISWRETNNSDPDPDGRVTGYKVYYRMVNTSKEHVLIVKGADNTHTTIEGIEEFSTYEIRVKAVNIYGEGNASEVYRCNTSEDAPSRPPFNVTAYDTSSTSLTIKWSDIVSQHENGIIRGFRIKYYKRIEGINASKIIVFRLNDLVTRRRRAAEPYYDKYSQELRGLDKYTEYVIQVLGFTVADGVYSPPLYVTTAEDAPTLPPIDVMAINTSSTSFKVAWSQVPLEGRNGIVRGFRIEYSEGNILERNISVTTVTYNESLVRPNATVNSTHSARRRRALVEERFSKEFSGLKMFTNYTYRVQAITVSRGEYSAPRVVTTDEDVPCMPPYKVTFDVPSKTSLKVMWNPVSKYCRNGVIRGYRVKYKKNEANSTWEIENTTSSEFSLIIHNMDRKANYTISVVAFTRKGDGNSTTDIALLDNIGTKHIPINVTAENLTTPWSIPVHWQPIQDPDVVEKLMGYRITWRAVEIGDMKVKDSPTYNYTVRKDIELRTVLERLDTYTKYEIGVSGFTRRGDGPLKIAFGETCRCHKRLTTNYQIFKPYSMVNTNNASLPIMLENMTGMLPPLLNDLAVTCCRTCKLHGGSYVDFERNGNNQRALAESDHLVKSRVGGSDFSFPIYGWKWQTTYAEVYRYIPLVESPGSALLIIMDETKSPVDAVVDSLLSTWSYIVLILLMALVAGTIMWFLDTDTNPDEFPPSYIKGSANGFWWSFISMTTVGYGDKSPVSFKARSFAIAWILIGLCVYGILSGAITNAVTTIVFESDFRIYGSKLAAIDDSPEYRLGVRKNARVNEDNNYTTFKAIFSALKNREVQGILMDTYQTGSEKNTIKDPLLHIEKIYDDKSTYGIVIAGNSTKLLSCSKGYMQANKAAMSQHISGFIDVVELNPVPKLLELSTGIFDAGTPIFKSTLHYSLMFLGVCALLAVPWELTRMFRNRMKVGQEELVAVKHKRILKEEMDNFVKEFCQDFEATSRALSKKHGKQRQFFINRHGNGLQEQSTATSSSSFILSKQLKNSLQKGSTC